MWWNILSNLIHFNEFLIMLCVCVLFAGRTIVYDLWRCTTPRFSKNWWKIASMFSKNWEFIRISTFAHIDNNVLLFLSLLMQSLAFQKINRAVTSIDSQPTFDGGVLINVLGRLQVSMNIILKSLFNSIANKEYFM